jgi:hypothetical protein
LQEQLDWADKWDWAEPGANGALVAIRGAMAESEVVEAARKWELKAGKRLTEAALLLAFAEIQPVVSTKPEWTWRVLRAIAKLEGVDNYDRATTGERCRARHGAGYDHSKRGHVCH